jgi:pimeloyl-ACP methyl ester carboxylesterase
MKQPALVLTFLMLSTGIAAQTAHSGAYTVKQGDTEVSREHYHFDGSVLTDTLDLTARGLRLVTEMVLSGSGAPVRYLSDVVNLATADEMQGLEVSFSDSVVDWTVTGAGATSGSTAIARPFVMMQNPAFAHLALALLRLDPAARDTQRLNMWIPEGAVVVELEVEFETPNSGGASIAGTLMEFETGDDGWIRRVWIPAQGVVVEWRQELGSAPGIETAGEADTVPPAAARESSYSFQSGDLRLMGTLTVPQDERGSIPVGVIIAGSGATDRNCNSGTSLRTNSYAQLAWRLAEHGIATLRYDKRGVGASQVGFDMAAATFDDFADDAAAAAQALAGEGQFSEIVFVGHSEGAALAIRAANGGAPVGGVILLAGMGRPFLDVLRGQLAESFDSSTIAQFDAAMPRYLAGDEIGELPASLTAFFRPVNRRFTETIAAFNPTAEIASLHVPVLIVQGGTDFQVTVTDAGLLAASKPEARLVVIDDANHVFKRAPDGSRASQTRSYIDPTMPIVPELVDAVATFFDELR